MVGGLPCVMTATRLTASALDCCCDSLVDVVGKLRVLAVHEVEEYLPVPLRAGKTGVYGSGGRPSPCERRLRDLPHDPPAHGCVPDDAATADLRAARFELRLDEDER